MWTLFCKNLTDFDKGYFLEDQDTDSIKNADIEKVEGMKASIETEQKEIIFKISSSINLDSQESKESQENKEKMEISSDEEIISMNSQKKIPSFELVETEDSKIIKTINTLHVSSLLYLHNR